MYFKAIPLFLIPLVLSVDAVRYKRKSSGRINTVEIEKTHMQQILSGGYNSTNKLGELAINSKWRTMSDQIEIDRNPNSLISVQTSFNPIDPGNTKGLTDSVVSKAFYELRDWILEMTPDSKTLRLSSTHGIEIWSNDDCIIGVVELKFEVIDLLTKILIPSRPNTRTISRRPNSTETYSTATTPSQSPKTTITTKSSSQIPMTTSTVKPLQKSMRASGGFPPLVNVDNMPFNSNLRINADSSDTCKRSTMVEMSKCRGPDTLLPDVLIGKDNSIFSQLGNARLHIEDNGNVCLFSYRPVFNDYFCWDHGQNFTEREFGLYVSRDGRLCTKSEKRDGTDPRNFCTSNKPGPDDGRYRLTLRNDGNLVLYRGEDDSKIIMQTFSEVFPYTGPEPCRASPF